MSFFSYCTNIVFYVLLKAKKIPVRDHPVLKTLFRYRQLLNQLQSVDDETIRPQVDKILEVFVNSKQFEAAEDKKEMYVKYARIFLDLFRFFILVECTLVMLYASQVTSEYDCLLALES